MLHHKIGHGRMIIPERSAFMKKIVSTHWCKYHMSNEDVENDLVNWY